MKAERNTPVMVVGGGPTGLMMGLCLRSLGVQCRVVDQAAAPSDKSKAIAIHARTLEIFESLGIVDEVLNRGHRVRGMHLAIDGHDILHVTFERIPGRYPFILTLAQSETERILLQRLESLGVNVERQTELTGLSQDSNGVEATLRRGDGSEEKVSAPFVIGCDGAHSTVRHLLEIPFEGTEYEQHFLLADVAIEWQFTEEEARTFLSAAGAAAFFPMGGGRYRIVAEIPARSAPPAEEPTLEQAQALIDRLGPSGTFLTDPRWLATFRIHRRKVADYRKGRVFLAGDAAHIHSPVGGQGMNTGIQDAHNLAWKLGLVLDGTALPALLDSYQAERHTVAEQVLRVTDTLTRMVTIRNPFARTIRDFLVPALAAQGFVQRRFTRMIAEVVVNYRHSPIVGQSRPRLREALRTPALGAKAWWAFSSGPRSGDRAPDAEPLRVDTQDSCRLLELIEPGLHNLLLFEGIEPGLKDSANLRRAAEMVADGFGTLIAVHVILAQSAPGESWPARVVVDAELAAHRAYGATASCLYLIRPDGYIGFRSLPVSRDSLGGYLGRIFRLRAFGAS